ncbi:unknown protein [Simkania negevensis Z]|uniref:Uncharacterized protein n=1 Tax=Simkania negevensis (strain ATCC VR-1471 / DSM 27360 / Z) TaxID=331113 RepID=F8L8U8_SIMNZ|nr:unknown protein [Simkania negevensis Z]
MLYLLLAKILFYPFIKRIFDLLYTLPFFDPEEFFFQG